MSNTKKTIVLDLLFLVLFVQTIALGSSENKTKTVAEKIENLVTADINPTTINIDVNDPRTVITTVIEALKSIKHPLSGKGSALVKVHDNDSTSEQMVDFMFKGDMSRSDRFIITNGRKGLREVGWAVGQECSAYCYKNSRVVLQAKPARQFHRKIGEDFNPDTFLRYSPSQSLAEHLERVIKNQSPLLTISTKLDSKGILHLVTDWKDEKTHQHQVISVDTTKGYRWVSELYTSEYPNDPNRNYTKRRKIHWDRYGASWYIKTAEKEYNGYRLLSKDGLRAMGKVRDRRESLTKNDFKIKKSYKKQTKVSVKEFIPNPEIKDSEFTFLGLGIPIGTRVHNKIKDEYYEYDGTPVLRKIAVPKRKGPKPKMRSRRSSENKKPLPIAVQVEEGEN